MAGLLQKELAELLGVPQSQVADWEYDRYGVIEVRSLIKLAKAFHCSVDELLVGVDPDYDRVLEHIVVRASAAGTWPDIAVVGEGDARPDYLARNEYGQGRPEVLGWLPRPAGLDDARAYGVQIRGDAMLPAYRRGMIALASPARVVRDSTLRLSAFAFTHLSPDKGNGSRCLWFREKVLTGRRGGDQAGGVRARRYGGSRWPRSGCWSRKPSASRTTSWSCTCTTCWVVWSSRLPGAYSTEFKADASVACQ